MGKNALRKWRKKEKLTQIDLSNEVGIPQPVISMHENSMKVSPAALKKYKDSKLIPDAVLDKLEKQ